MGYNIKVRLAGCVNSAEMLRPLCWVFFFCWVNLICCFLKLNSVPQYTVTYWARNEVLIKAQALTSLLCASCCVLQWYSCFSINTTNVHRYNQSVTLDYFGFILSLLHFSVCLDSCHAVAASKYILLLLKCANMDPC